MSITPAQLKIVREAIGVAITGSMVSGSTKTKLTAINQQIIDGTYMSLNGDADAAASVSELHEAVNDVTLYADAVEAFAKEVFGSVPAPTPTQPKPPQSPVSPSNGDETVNAPAGMTQQEIDILRDLNFAARRDYRTLETGSPYQARLLTMSYALKDGASWTDPDAAYLLGMVAATKDGVYPPNRAVIEKYATLVGLSIKDVPPPSASPLPASPTPPVPETPATPSLPSVSDDVAAQVRAALITMGFEFAANGQVQGFALNSNGDEGDVPGYVGVNDGALRMFWNVARMIGLPWPNVRRNPKLPMIMHAYERDGGISWDYDPPLLATDPNPRPFKTLIMYLAGFVRDAGPRGKSNVGKYIDIGTFESGRGIRFFRKKEWATPNTDTALGFDDHPANPTFFKLNGTLRRIYMDADGRLIAGEVVEESA